MVIDIIGGGSLGLLHVAMLLSNSPSIDGNNVEVRLWTRTEEQALLIRNQGIYFEGQDGRVAHIHPVRAYPLEEAGEVLEQTGMKSSCIWLFVKQTHIDSDFLGYLDRIPREKTASLVCYQNGVGHMEVLSSIWPREQLLWAVTTEAAKRVSSNKVIRTGSGQTSIGIWNASSICPNKTDLATSLCLSTKKLLENAGFQAFLSNNIEGMVYQKLLVNVIINPLTALLRIKNGQLLAQEDRLSFMKDLFLEAVAVYRAAHIDVDEEKDWNRVVQVCRMTSSNSSSMLQDVEAGRETEIEAITGALIRMAEQYEVAVPLHRMMYRLILASCD
ncbi:2-dehydropantoate 2-reductase [Paenibacillus sp. S-12]|uniref:ketopantoate reductase family protein n=1 Tax=Paenibacillus sp. S-12 TaxID=3031371 RepID=UPI0025A2060F|nr:2-dehydropantoate 2-reductase [Paenibacillus sp. S-12]